MRKIYIIFLLILNSILVFSQTTRYVNKSATGANNGTSWTNAYTNLQTAISSCSVGDILWIAKGTYTPHANDITVYFSINGLTLIGGFAGTETAISQRNIINNPTILSGDLAGNLSLLSYHVVFVQATGNPTKIDGLYISRGNAEGATGDPRLGGGIKINGATPTVLNISNCVFENNRAANGGAVYVYGSHTATIENCIFNNNYCDICGASVYKYGTSNVTVSNCTFVTTNGTNDVGVMYANNFNVYNSVFKSSSGKHLSSYYWGKINFTNCIFSGNPTTDSVNIFTNNKVNTDPLLAADFSLQAGSPAINAGNNSYSTLSTDIKGAQRIVDNIVDMGAIEYKPAAPSKIDDVLQNSEVVTVYPNPVRNQLQIKLNLQSEIQSIILTDGNGLKTLPEYEKSGNEIKVNMSGYPNGIYILQIQTNLQSYFKKIVKR